MPKKRWMQGLGLAYVLLFLSVAAPLGYAGTAGRMTAAGSQGAREVQEETQNCISRNQGYMMNEALAHVKCIFGNNWVNF